MSSSKKSLMAHDSTSIVCDTHVKYIYTVYKIHWYVSECYCAKWIWGNKSADFAP